MVGHSIVECRDCGQPIFFKKNSKGRFLPVNEPLITIVDFQGREFQGYRAHWDTCQKIPANRLRVNNG